VETRVIKGEWDGKPVLFGVSKDITELKRSEEKFTLAFHIMDRSGKNSGRPE
jgi:hypothetical protein